MNALWFERLLNVPLCMLSASVAHLHGAASSLGSITYSYKIKGYLRCYYLFLVKNRYFTELTATRTTEFKIQQQDESRRLIFIFHTLS